MTHLLQQQADFWDGRIRFIRGRTSVGDSTIHAAREAVQR